MKRQLTKTFILLILGLISSASTMAQVDVFNADEYDADGFLKLTDKKYPKVDTLHADIMLGDHWKGQQLNPNGMDSVYFVNVKTGEYFSLEGYKGATGVTDHVGLLLRIESTTDGIPVKNARFPNDPQVAYRIASQAGHNNNINDRFLGRTIMNDGKVGTFEHNKLLTLKDKKEYQLHINSQTSPGGFVWYFHPVKEDPEGGYQYIIYTHRQTRIEPIEGVMSNALDHTSIHRLREYENRESYLCISSVDGNSIPGRTTDYNNVLFKKFAGQMYYEKGDTIWYTKMKVGVQHLEVDPATNDWPADQHFVVKANWSPVEDEKGKPKFVSLEDGLSTIGTDEANLWKIVSFKERKAYNLTASETRPVDVTFNISNNRFYNVYKYSVMDELMAQPNFDWTWYDNGLSNPTAAHVHPYRYSVGTGDSDYSEKKEFHKIGTGYYHCYAHGIADEVNTENNINNNRRGEAVMTGTHDANLCASIFNGSAMLQQTITGLRPGNYIVYVRGFYAPHSMMNYTTDNSGVPQLRNSSDVYGFTETDARNAINDKKQGYGAYLFASSKPNGKDVVLHKRRLPSIYEGLTPYTDEKKTNLSKESYMASEEFKYSQLGDQYAANPEHRMFNVQHKVRYNALKDSTVFAKIPGSWVPGATADYYIVPRTISGAARFFDTTDRDKYPEANNYRVGIPVSVGYDGTLTIGVNQTFDTSLPAENRSTQGEWVCFDNFELFYLGLRKPNDFVVDESDGINNTYITDYEEFQTPAKASATDAEGGSYKTLILRRTLYRDKFMPIVLPVSLSKKQVKEGFGDDTKLSILQGLTGTTIFYQAVSLDGNQTDIAMEAGKPYIIKPSAYPMIDADSTYQRQKFPPNYQTEDGKPSAYADQYVVGKNRQNNMNAREGKIHGPIYIIDSVLIKQSTVFPRIEKTPQGGWRAASYFGANLDNVWTEPKDFQPQGPVQVVGDNSGKTYKLTAKVYYRPNSGVHSWIPANKSAVWTNGIIPNYSYYHAVDGKMYFTGTRQASAKKGLGAYLQLLEQVNGQDGEPQQGAKEIVFSDSWLNGEYYFVDATGTTGITTLEENPATTDDAWYTVEGVRLDGQPTKPGIYINGGKKKIVK